MLGSVHGQAWEQQFQPCLLLLLLSRFSRVRFCATPWTAAYQAPPSMGFSGQQYWSGVLLPSPAALPRPHLKPKLPDPGVIASDHRTTLSQCRSESSFICS